MCLTLQERHICRLIRNKAFIRPLQVICHIQYLRLHGGVTLLHRTILKGQLVVIIHTAHFRFIHTAHFRYIGCVRQKAPKSLYIHLWFFNFGYVIDFLYDLHKNLLLNFIKKIIFYIILLNSVLCKSRLVTFCGFFVLYKDGVKVILS